MNRMVDYKCDKCGHQSEAFYHSDPPASVQCSELDCEGVAYIYQSVPGEARTTNAQRFDPIVIWQHDTDPNRFSFPGRNNEKCDPGYHAIEIKTMREAQKWQKHINGVYTHQKEWDIERDRMMFADRLKERRADRAAKIAGNPQLEAFNRLMVERQDRKRANRYDHGSQDVHFHIQALEFNQSNRQDWCDKDTGWKSRRG